MCSRFGSVGTIILLTCFSILPILIMHIRLHAGIVSVRKRQRHDPHSAIFLNYLSGVSARRSRLAGLVHSVFVAYFIEFWRPKLFDSLGLKHRSQAV